MGGKHDLLFVTKRESFVFAKPMMMIKHVLKMKLFSKKKFFFISFSRF